MQVPPTPPNELDRLRELDAYQILDTLPEKDYDALTRLAAQICGTPISLVSLVDDHRQWFKSHHGLDAAQTPKEYAFCAHAINQPDSTFIINDAREDERFKDNPLVTGDPHVVFYAGMPLVTQSGLPLGTLCVIDHKPSDLTQEQLESLEHLAGQVMNLLELHKKEREMEKLISELESRNDELEQFAQVAAHDLKSPLNNISMLTDMLEADFGESMGQEGKDMLGMLARSSSKLKSMVDGLLEYSRSERHANVSPEKIKLSVLEEDLQEVLMGMEKGNVKVQSDLREVYTNRTALEQVLVNLTVNAIKYNDKPETEVQINVRETPSKYILEVSDNGPGIPTQMQEKIFDIFQVGSAKDRYGHRGNGIGLATVKKVAEAMGGSISLIDSKKEGTTFRFSFEKPLMKETSSSRPLQNNTS